MISKNHVKFIKSLQIKKFRRLHQQFLIEGAKNITELLQSDFEITALFLTENFKQYCLTDIQMRCHNVHWVKENDLENIGSFSSNNTGIAIAKMKDNIPFDPQKGEYILVLDQVKDPGNLGTIIRIADWYGITRVVCSEDTAEFYNPKVISATMGSFTRINLFYTNLAAYLNKNSDFQVYGAVLGGSSIYDSKFSKDGFILMGNESSGIREDLLGYIDHKITIPKRGGAESLNVAVATGIICDNIMREK
ncbi:MAG: TrmH family RNA methyltransferase [Cytophagaceae bacterium]